VESNFKIQSKFVQIFGNKSQDIAKRLLNKALLTQDDQEIKKEIKKRLKSLQPKPKIFSKCNVCGKDFQIRKYKWGRRKTCNECKSKMGIIYV
jgi:hypothetical protein